MIYGVIFFLPYSASVNAFGLYPLDIVSSSDSISFSARSPLRTSYKYRIRSIARYTSGNRFIKSFTVLHRARPSRTAHPPAGAFGAALSGAGPSVIALIPKGDETLAKRVGYAMEFAFRKAGVAARSMMLDIDMRGARVRTRG